MPNQNPQKQSKKKLFNQYLKYTTLGFQMLATVILGLLIGRGLDKWLETSTPYFTLIFVLLFIFVALYIPVKELMNKK